MNIREKISSLEVIIFDCDGVVIDSEPIIFEAARRLFNEFSIDLQHADIAGGIGAGPKYLSDPLEKYQLHDKVTLQQLIDGREHYYKELAVEKLRPMDGFLQLHQLIKNLGLKSALASSAMTSTIYFNLAAASILPSDFDYIVDSSKVTNKKPAPDIFLAAADYLKVHPKRCLVVEDALTGIEAAHRADMPCVALTSSFDQQKLAAADWVIDHLDELTSLFTTN